MGPSRGSATLRIGAVRYRDDGSYTCTATSPAGTAEQKFVISVERGDGGFGDLGTYHYQTPLYVVTALLLCSVPTALLFGLLSGLRAFLYLQFSLKFAGGSGEGEFGNVDNYQRPDESERPGVLLAIEGQDAKIT